MPTKPLRRLAASPLWWASLALLVLNDHVLKHAWPSAVTGKLSDFAGLVVAAPLLAALVARTPASRVAAYLATGLVFAAINVSRGAADLVEAILPWRIWTDPSDLLALPMLGVAWLRFERAELKRAAELASRRQPLEDAPTRAALGWSERLTVALGGFACLATSPGPFPVDVPTPFMGELQLLGMYAEDLEAESEIRETLRVRRLRPEVAVSCDELRANPRDAVTRGLFAPAERWSLGHRETISLAVERDECDIVWLEHDEAGVALVHWSAFEAVRITLQRNGSAIAWVESIGVDHLVRRTPRTPIPARTCEPLATPPVLSAPWPSDGGVYTLVANASPDGCTELTITPFDEAATPAEPAPEEPTPEEPTPEEPTPEEPTPDVPEEPSSITIFACGHPAELFAFDGPVHFELGASLRIVQLDESGALRRHLAIREAYDPSAIHLDFEASAISECRASNGCGEIVIPWQVEAVSGEWTATGPHAFSHVTEDQERTLHVLHAQQGVAMDGACVDGVSALGPHFVIAETTLVYPTEPEEPVLPEDPMPEEPLPGMP